ncbi:uncharacterized protein LOC112847934 isoform X6 [Oreochromis niloticus]|uniref:uncharacterized protein LOC112847934 isoform X6 n=1 Tax=Oreochromis niloticus TaxID=8128 RepID=UPI000DF47503|nr:uncharacterized protein LOC112847934 isoform X6 [Oreochromis niloticus]
MPFDQHKMLYSSFDQHNILFSPLGQHKMPFGSFDQHKMPFGSFDQHKMPFGSFDQHKMPFGPFDQHKMPLGLFSQDKMPFRPFKQHKMPFREEETWFTGLSLGTGSCWPNTTRSLQDPCLTSNVSSSLCVSFISHTEVISTGGGQFLQVAHVNDECIEFINPHLRMKTLHLTQSKL